MSSKTFSMEVTYREVEDGGYYRGIASISTGEDSSVNAMYTVDTQEEILFAREECKRLVKRLYLEGCDPLNFC